MLRVVLSTLIATIDSAMSSRKWHLAGIIVTTPAFVTRCWRAGCDDFNLERVVAAFRSVLSLHGDVGRNRSDPDDGQPQAEQLAILVELDVGPLGTTTGYTQPSCMKKLLGTLLPLTLQNGGLHVKQGLEKCLRFASDYFVLYDFGHHYLLAQKRCCLLLFLHAHYP